MRSLLVLFALCAALTPGVSRADIYVTVELGSHTDVELSPSPSGRWYGDYANGAACWVWAPDGTEFYPYDTDTPLLTGGCHTAGLTRFQRTFAPRDSGDLGRWTVTCMAYHFPETQCGDAANACGYACTGWPDTGIEESETWRIDVVPHIPDLTITDHVGTPLGGSIDVSLGDRIVLNVEPYDPDFTYRWNLTRPDAGGVFYDVALGTHFEHPAEAVGTWRIFANAEGFGRTSSAWIDVNVRNRPPRWSLAGPAEIHIGEDLIVETTVLTDDDGGALTFQWEPVQVPTAALSQRDSAILDQSRVTIPTDASSAGTWSFVLQVCDDERECRLSERRDIHVDGPPVADIDGPTVVTPFDFPLVLDGTGSVDTDADCSVDASCLHWVAPGESLSGVHPLLRYSWYADGLPASTVFHVPDTGSELVLEYRDIPPGSYAFRLAVDDFEGNLDEAWHYLEVRDLDAPPVANLSAPRRYLTDVDGYLSETIVVDGSLSYDPDNIFGPSPTPDAGIVSYAWTATPPSPDCPRPTFGNTQSITPFAALDLIPPSCLGTWTVQLTVTDTDGATGTEHTRFLIGNCSGDVCIDYPTGDNRAEIGIGGDVDVQVFYHIDPLVYDALPYGFYTQLDILPAGGTSPVFTLTDTSAYVTGPGSILTFYWDGYANVGTHAGTRAPTGQYDVRISIFDVSSSPTPYGAREPLAIAYESPELRPSATSDRYVSRSALSERSDRFDFTMELVDTLGVDTWRWTVRNGLGAVATRRVVSSPSAVLNDSWDGRSGSVLQPPGEYVLEVEAYRDTYLLATVAVPLIVYDLRLEPVGGGERVRLLVNADDDDGDGLIDLVDGAITGEDDLKGLAVSMEPMVGGTATLIPSSLLALHDDATKTSACSAPCEFTVSDMPLDGLVYVEGGAPGAGEVALEFVTHEGISLPPVTLPVDVVHLEVLDQFKLATSSLRVGLWDRGYDGDGALLNEADPTRNFVDRDLHRFYVRLTDPASDADPTVRDVVTAQVGTLLELPYSGSPDFTDPPSEILLIETGVDSGVFESEAQLLTSNDDPALIASSDDAYPVTTGDGVLTADEWSQDRTHRVGRDGAGYLEGGVQVVVSDVVTGAMPVRAEVPVCRRDPDERQRVWARAVILQEPFDDTGYVDSTGTPWNTFGAFDFEDLNGNTQHDPGEPSEPYMDLSHDPSGRWVRGDDPMPPRDGRGPVATREHLDNEIRKANLAWAPACVEVELLSVVESDSPPGTMEYGIFKMGGPEDDSESILRNYYSERIDILFLVVTGPNLALYTDTVGGVDLYASLGGFAAVPISGLTYGQSVVFLASGQPIWRRTLAHELGHALTNGLDVVAPDWVFFPNFVGPENDDVVERYRRFSDATRNTALLRRDSGAYYFDHPGNTLLHPY